MKSKNLTILELFTNVLKLDTIYSIQMIYFKWFSAQQKTSIVNYIWSRKKVIFSLPLLQDHPIRLVDSFPL